MSVSAKDFREAASYIATNTDTAEEAHNLVQHFGSFFMGCAPSFDYERFVNETMRAWRRRHPQAGSQTNEG